MPNFFLILTQVFWLTGTIICIQWTSSFDEAMQVLQEHEVATKMKFIYKYRYKPKLGNISILLGDYL